ncbi:methyltransferases [Legionella sainthelensi]|uniref:class I SAM-dependent methyltransferase n=1 Tax=Legionella sainthelensi TaxID=28087 RepID=UPI000E20940C|nr:methyltransferase domain-containing protein [Legionella sainthelensi]VEB38991.1 methyltransferases [Legionella sainthelensi]
MSIYDSRELFKTYFANASEKSILIDLMRTRFSPALLPLNILDLGCHDGHLIKKIIDAYAWRMPSKVTLTGVDPSIDALLEYSKNKFTIPVHTNTYTGTAESYFLRHSGDEYFDWVIASQCLYWSLDLPYIVRNIARCGKSGLIVLRGHRGIYEIQSRFKAYIGNRNEQFYTAVDIESALLHLNIPFEKEIKTTFIQLPPQGSVEMKWLIAFFLQQDEKNISNNIVQEVESWILAKTSDKMAHDVSFFWLGNAMLKNK